MSPLLLCLLAMAVAPFVDRVLSRRPRSASFADGLVQVVVGGILLVHVLPSGLAAAGAPALLALGAGAMVGVLAHRVPGGERSAGAIAVLALLLHAGIDGAALAAPDEHGDHEGGGMLAWAVVLHTLPVGLATWRISVQRGGARFAAGLLAATAAATVAGWFAADTILHDASPAALGIAQCAVAGALLHVLGHVGEDLPRRPAGWGGLLGVAVVMLLTFGHPLPPTHASELAAGPAFLTLLVASAPALLLGYLVAGVLRAFAPPLIPGREMTGAGLLARVPAAVQGALIGLPVPVRSCGSLPVYRRFLARGAPGAAALAFLVAGPEIGFGAIAISLPLLGAELAALRVGAAFLVAVGVGALLAPARLPTRVEPAAVRPARPLAARAREALRLGFVDTVDHTAPWVLVGLGVASLTEPLLAGDALAGVPTPVAVIIGALIGLPAYVCAAGATPLVAVLLHKGLSAGAALAFLLAGSAVNIATFTVLRELHGRGLAVRYGAAVLAAAVGVGLATDALFPNVKLPSLHSAAASAHGPVAWASAAVVLVLFAAALVRNGAAGFLEPLLHAHGGEPHVHHGHGHGHSHAHAHAAVPVFTAAAAPFTPTFTPAPGGPGLVARRPVRRDALSHDHPAHGHDGHDGHDHDGHDHDHGHDHRRS